MKVDEHKHLGIILDSKLSFSANINAAITKSRKGIGTQVTGKIDKNNKYLSLYFSVCRICQLCLDKANDDDEPEQTVPVSTPKEKRFQGLQVSLGHHSFLRLSCLALQSIGQYSFHTWPQNVRQ